jgi:hypothetical protein
MTGRVRAFLKEYGSITRQEMIDCCGIENKDKAVFRVVRSLRNQGWKLDCDFYAGVTKGRDTARARWTVYNDEAEIGNIERYLQATPRYRRHKRAPKADTQGGVVGPSDRPLANGREAGRTKHGD